MYEFCKMLATSYGRVAGPAFLSSSVSDGPKPDALALSRNLTQKTFSVRDRPAEIFRDRFAHVGQRFAHSERYPRAASRRVSQNRHVLARVIRGFPSRIGVASVIRGNHQQIARLQQRQKC